ncbi:unnamed protein product [Chilo suppressalis]|uniref:Uncharacterized protein n=1 Tax=Chilo suppressalis TaxID=168631 RepID=A0ABN8B5A4_CHISP|nr:unnamed protein product [Chilo suppressalis]
MRRKMCRSSHPHLADLNPIHLADLNPIPCPVKLWNPTHQLEVNGVRKGEEEANVISPVNSLEREKNSQYEGSKSQYCVKRSIDFSNLSLLLHSPDSEGCGFESRLLPALIDDDIRDDANCAQKVFDMEGFKYWSKWEARCKGHMLPDIENSSPATPAILTLPACMLLLHASFKESQVVRGREYVSGQRIPSMDSATKK